MKKILHKFYLHVFLFILLAVVGTSIIHSIEKDKERQYLKNQAELLQTKYNTNYKYFKIISHDIYQMYADNKKLTHMLALVLDSDVAQQNKLRQQVYQLLKKRYKRIRSMGIEEINFHLTDKKVFLRMNDPTLYGDDLTTIRHTVQHALAKKHLAEGFEVSTYLHGFRFVYPFYDGKKYLGVLDISFSSKKLIENIKDNYTNDIHFLIAKTELQKKNNKESYYEKSWESDAFMIETATHKTAGDINLYQKIQNTSLQKQIEQKLTSNKPFSLATIYNYESIVLSFIPIKNDHNTITTAYLVTYTDSDYLDNIIMQQYYIKILFYSLLFMVFIFGVYVISNKEKLKEMAHYDTLTKLPNRSFFYIEFQSALNRAQRHKTGVALLFIDLDGFKSVNDTYGHNVGDELLIEVAQRFKSAIRVTDIVARLGGDEFTIILSDIKHENEAIKIAQKIINTINEEFIIHHNVIRIGTSIGIALYPQHGKDIDTLVQNADNMMYEAKKSGKNNAILFVQKD